MNSYQRNYGSEAEPVWIEMVEIAPHSYLRRDFAERLGLVRR